MELTRPSENGVATDHAPSAIYRRLSGDTNALTAAIVGKEVVAPQAKGDGCRGWANLGGPCALSCLSGRAYTVYLIRVRHQGLSWIVRRRFREFCTLNDWVVDKELRAIFPPRSLCAKAGLACALETRQSRLAYYVKELAHKLAHEPCKEMILAFFHSRDGHTLGPDDGARPSFSQDEKGERGSSEEAEGARTAVEQLMLSTIRLSTLSGAEELGPSGNTFSTTESKPRPSLAVQRAALARLVPLLMNGITVIKHGRRGPPKLRLIFCDEDCSRVYWASDRQASSSSSSSTKRSNLSSLAIADVTEVRECTAPDPNHPGLLGTATLRRRRASSIAVPVMLRSGSRQPPAPRAFSLIATARSLDLEALNSDDFTLLLEGFRAAVGLNTAAAVATAEAAAAGKVAGAAVVAVEGKGKKASPA